MSMKMGRYVNIAGIQRQIITVSIDFLFDKVIKAIKREKILELHDAQLPGQTRAEAMRHVYFPICV